MSVMVQVEFHCCIIDKLRHWFWCGLFVDVGASLRSSVLFVLAECFWHLMLARVRRWLHHSRVLSFVSDWMAVRLHGQFTVAHNTSMQFCCSLIAVMRYWLLTLYLSHTEQFEVSRTPDIFSFLFCSLFARNQSPKSAFKTSQLLSPALICADMYW